VPHDAERDTYLVLDDFGGDLVALGARPNLEIAEAKLVDTQQFVEGTLTQFSGFPFGHDHPFTYLEGKRVLGLALGELRGNRHLRDVLGMKPKAPGRPAITGRQGDAVWDFLSLSSASKAENFTKYPHLTLGIVASAVEAVVTRLSPGSATTCSSSVIPLRPTGATMPNSAR
jgi:hypothetical protein